RRCTSPRWTAPPTPCAPCWRSPSCRRRPNRSARSSCRSGRAGPRGSARTVRCTGCWCGCRGRAAWRWRRRCAGPPGCSARGTTTHRCGCRSTRCTSADAGPAPGCPVRRITAPRLSRMRLVFAGTPEAALPSLRRLIDSPRHEVVAVLTRPDAAAGRRARPAPSPVAKLASEHGIPVLRPPSPNTDEFIAELTELAPDCCPVVAYGALLSERLLAVPRHGWVNLHFSLLPAWRGAAPVQAAIAAGDTVTGASTFRIEPALDSGPIYGVVTETIRPTDTAGDLLDRLADSGAELLERT